MSKRTNVTIADEDAGCFWLIGLFCLAKGLGMLFGEAYGYIILGATILVVLAHKAHRRYIDPKPPEPPQQP